jgi:hypothetical protein
MNHTVDCDVARFFWRPGRIVKIVNQNNAVIIFPFIRFRILNFVCVCVRARRK